jgi:rubrerythrin
VELQYLNWHDMVRTPISKLDDDAFTRVRIVLMSALEDQALRFAHGAARASAELREGLARVRRIELHQGIAVRSLLGADHSALELALAHKQCAVEVGAALAQREAHESIASALRFVLLEDMDHLYRFAALLDRVEGRDANNILQSYTDIVPARPSILQHRAPHDDLLASYDCTTVGLPSRLHLLCMQAGASQMRGLFAHAGVAHSDPVVRQLLAEIASIEEQHATHFASLIDPRETWLEQWLLHEAAEAWSYAACVQQESDSRIKAFWEQMLDYEIGQFHFVAGLLRTQQGQDPQRLVPRELPEPLPFASQREFVRKVMREELELSVVAQRHVPRSQESQATRDYRAQVDAEGSPSEAVAAGYTWTPGTELARLHPANA